jgi:hypothetical protein
LVDQAWGSEGSIEFSAAVGLDAGLVLGLVLDLVAAFALFAGGEVDKGCAARGADVAGVEAALIAGGAADGVGVKGVRAARVSEAVELALGEALGVGAAGAALDTLVSAAGVVIPSSLDMFGPES